MKRPSPRRSSRAPGFVAFLAASWFARGAPAAEPVAPARVEIRVAPCSDPPYDPARFAELLRVELTAFHVEATPTNAPALPGDAVAHAVIALSASDCKRLGHEAELRVTDGETHTELARRVELADIAFDARARTLAIAAAELYRAATTESPVPAAAPAAPSGAPLASAAPAAAPVALTAAAPPPRPPAPPRATQPALDAEPDRSAKTTLEAAFVYRNYASERSALLGGDLAARARVASWLGARAGAELGFGAATLPFDDANAVTGNVALGLALGHVGLMLRSKGSPSIELGPRLALGYGWVERRLGSPQTRVNGWISELALEASVLAPISSRCFGFIKLDLGHSLGGVALEAAARTPGATSVGLAGIFFGAGIGVGLEP